MGREAGSRSQLEAPLHAVTLPLRAGPCADARGRVVVLSWLQPVCQPCVVQRFELFIGGKEVVNAYVELNDPDIQLQRFGMQAKVRGEEV